MQKIKYEEMRPDEIAAARANASVAYVPIGSTEYHGFHLPVGLDTLHSYALCLAAAEQTGGVVLPPTFWGTRGHEQYPGSLLLHEDTIACLMRDVFLRLAEQGWELVVAFTGHYPKVQGELIRRVAQEHMGEHPGSRVLVLDPFSLHPTDPRGEHAGCIETSAMLHLRPDLVAMEQLQKPGALKAITPDCVDGNAEAGKERFGTIVAELVRAVREALADLAARGG